MIYIETSFPLIKVVIVVLIDVFILVMPIFLIESHKKHPFINEKYIKKIVLLWYIVLFFSCLMICLHSML